jgi:ankyrin repeat protein
MQILRVILSAIFFLVMAISIAAPARPEAQSQKEFVEAVTTSPVKSDLHPVIRLVIAVEKGDIPTVRQLVAEGADINALDFDACPALFHALGRFERAQIGPDGRYHTSMQTPPRRQVLTPQQREMASFLIANGANVNYKSIDNCTPLGLAALAGEAQLVRELINGGADVNVDTSPEDVSTALTPLMEAARGGNPDVVKLLIDHGAVVNCRYSARQVYGDGFTPLVWAVSQGNLEATRVLIANGAEVNLTMPDGRTVLMLAGSARRASAGDAQREMLKMFLDSGATTNGETANGETVISAFTPKGDVDTIKLLMSKGAKVDPKGISGRFALSQAVSSKNAELAKFFIQQGVDVNTNTPLSRTLLEEAAGNDDVSMVRHLLDAGADPNFRGTSQGTALAAAAKSAEITALLLKHGADVNPRDENSGPHFYTPIYKAVSQPQPNFEVVKMLLEAGADPNVPANWGGKTALDVAIEQRSHSYGYGNAKDEWKAQRLRASIESIIPLLIKHGARRSQK